MKISVSVKTKSKSASVSRIEHNRFKVSVKSPPAEGKANREVEEVLAEFLGLPKSKVFIVSGFKSKNKIVEIP